MHAPHFLAASILCCVALSFTGCQNANSPEVQAEKEEERQDVASAEEAAGSEDSPQAAHAPRWAPVAAAKNRASILWDFWTGENALLNRWERSQALGHNSATALKEQLQAYGRNQRADVNRFGVTWRKMLDAQ